MFLIFPLNVNGMNHNQHSQKDYFSMFANFELLCVRACVFFYSSFVVPLAQTPPPPLPLPPPPPHHLPKELSVWIVALSLQPVTLRDVF